MPTLRLETSIAAPPVVCFDLARDIDLHRITAARTSERVVGGVTSGKLESGASVTFEAVHFGVRQRLTSRITEFERPRHFVDEMQRGAFKRFRHVHDFVPAGAGTLMIDVLEWTSPVGWLGCLFDALVLKRHLRCFLEERNRGLKRAAEDGIVEVVIG